MQQVVAGRGLRKKKNRFLILYTMGTTKGNLGSYLSNEGFQPQETDFGFVFKFKELTFAIFWDDDDNQYLKLVLPSIYNVNDNNRDDSLVAANQVNIEWKVIKAVVHSDEVWVVAEQLIDKDPNLSDLIPRTIQILMQGRESFYKHLEEI